MKKFICMSLAILMLLFTVVGCGTSTSSTGKEGTTASQAPTKKILIGASFPTSNLSPFAVKLYNEFVAQCKAKGWDTKVLDAEGDATKQATQVDSLLTMGIDLLVYWPADRSAAVAACKKAQDQKIPVVILNSDIDKEGQQYAAAFVGPDQFSLSSAIADYLEKSLKGQGNVVIINGVPANTTYILRTEGFKAQLKKLDSKLVILANEYANADRMKAQTIMENFLTKYPNIDVVFGISDNVTIGAINAIKASGRKGIKVVSIDGMKEGFQAIKDGTMEMTVLQAPKDQITKAVGVIEQVLQGKKMDYYNYSEYHVVTKDNVDTYEPAY